jgi:hypothetical protein
LIGRIPTVGGVSWKNLWDMVEFLVEDPIEGEHVIVWYPLDGIDSVAICVFGLDGREKSIRVLVLIAIQDNIVVAICWKSFIEKLDKG